MKKLIGHSWILWLVAFGFYMGWEVGVSVQAQTFTRVEESAGVSRTGPGAAWGDYDNDGDLDLYVPIAIKPNALYRNNGNETFTDMAVIAGVDDPGRGVATAWGDYDNDGDLDLTLSNRPIEGEGGVNRLYRNNGDGAFTEVGASAGVSGSGDWAPIVWGDYNSDGYLDLSAIDSIGPDRLYRNNANGTFTDAAASAGISDNDPARGAAWGDYDDDGDLDLYVTSSFGGNRLYQNNDYGTFTDVAMNAGVGDPNGEGVGPAWGDYDDDGDLDLYVSNQTIVNRLYQNNGNGTFSDVAISAGITHEGGHGVVWGDYDNDGDLDLHVAVNQKNRLYENNGNGAFTDVAVNLGMDFSVDVVSAQTWGDYDDDGDLDLYVANVTTSNQLYRNEGTPNRWLHVKLTGTQSNRSAIGARVVAVAGGKRQLWDVDGGSGFCGQPSLPVEFGFGQTTIVDSLIIRWPSGIVQTFTGLETNQRLAITEDNPLITAVEEETATLPSAFSLSQNYPNPFNPQTTIHYQVPEEAEIRLTILDLAGQQVRVPAAGAHQPGQYSAVWDGMDASGRAVASGVYLYRLEVVGQGIVETRRMALVR